MNWQEPCHVLYRQPTPRAHSPSALHNCSPHPTPAPPSTGRGMELMHAGPAVSGTPSTLRKQCSGPACPQGTSHLLCPIYSGTTEGSLCLHPRELSLPHWPSSERRSDGMCMDRTPGIQSNSAFNGGACTGPKQLVHPAGGLLPVDWSHRIGAAFARFGT